MICLTLAYVEISKLPIIKGIIMPAKPTAVISLSGGLDSCVATAIAHANGFNLALLHANYGQLTHAREYQAFNDIANFYEVKPKMRLVTQLASLQNIGGSSITDTNIPLPNGNLNREDIPNSYVPFRNAHLLATAVSWAEVINASTIFVGFVEEDSSGYPDCQESFLQAFELAANLGTKPSTQIKLAAPLIHMKKHEIVSIGLKIGAPLNLSWSCYQNNKEACGYCDSCLIRLRGFAQANAIDPICYATTIL